jgi:phage-related protein
MPPLLWAGSSRCDYKEFPCQVQSTLGFKLLLAQTGQHRPRQSRSKALGSGVVELIENHDGDTYRAVYTARFVDTVDVLHAFKKKSKHGIATPKSDIASIKRRLRDAQADHAERFKPKRQP